MADISYQLVRHAGDSGKYASESEVVEYFIAGLCLEPVAKKGADFERWMRDEVLAANDELEADPASGMTPEQLRAKLAQARAKRN